MPVLVIYLVGAGSARLIAFMGWIWRWRHLLSTSADALLSAALVTGLIVLWPRATATPVVTFPPAPVAPTLSILTWGESDSSSDVISSATPSPGHVVFAALEVTAGDTALSIPALGAPSPVNLLWLGIRDTGRPTLTDQARLSVDGTLWLPSHSAELVLDFGSEPLMFPDAGCVAVAPGDRCEIVVVWELGQHGSVQALSLSLMPASADPATAIPTATTSWPDSDTAQPVCEGPIEAWCDTQ